MDNDHDYDEDHDPENSPFLPRQGAGGSSSSSGPTARSRHNAQHPNSSNNNTLGSTNHSGSGNSLLGLNMPNFSTWSRKDFVFYGILWFLVGLLLFNSVTRDYKAETRSYLTSIGKKDAIDKVVPKTYEEIVQERKNREALVDQLAGNMTTVLKELKYLRTEVDNLKKQPLIGINPPLTTTTPK